MKKSLLALGIGVFIMCCTNLEANPTPTTEIYAQVNPEIKSQLFSKLLVYADPALSTIDRMAVEEGIIKRLNDWRVPSILVASTQVIFSGEKDKWEKSKEVVRVLKADGIMIILVQPIMSQQFHTETTGDSTTNSDIFQNIFHRLFGYGVNGNNTSYSQYQGNTNGYSFQTAIGLNGTSEIMETNSGKTVWHCEEKTSGNGSGFGEIRDEFLSEMAMKLEESGLVKIKYHSFTEAYEAGSLAAKEKKWQDSCDAFNQALSMAETDKEKTDTEKWLDYLMGMLLQKLHTDTKN